MKYGEKLRQRSIPAWRVHDIDYNQVKFVIKERTSTSNNTKSAKPDDLLKETEDELFVILSEQHDRIDLFVKSKAREVQHRLNDAKKRLRQLAARQPPTGNRLSAARLERYSRLENDVLKAGEEIKSLARFTAAQRTGFGKLLKKYKKWTGSLTLDDRFREQVLNDPKSFTKYDIGPLLDDYSETLHNIRALYTSRLQDAATPEHEASSYLIGSSIISQLNASIAAKRKADFDTAIATVPVGESGRHASYFVHPDNTVELQILLVQHLNFYMSRSRQNSLVSPVSSTDGSPPVINVDEPDYFWLAADDPSRFVTEQDALNTADYEARVGSTPQRARIAARWNSDEAEAEALVAARVGETHVQVSKLRKKHVDSFFDKNTQFPPRRASVGLNQHLEDLDAIRSPYTRDPTARPLYRMSSHRSRFVGLQNSAKQVILATLDTGVSIQPASQNTGSEKTRFPFAVLIVRQEGLTSDSLISTLDNSHLVERVNGFSMEHHAIWSMFKQDVPAPSWHTLLSQDIRKLPPPALKHSDTSATSNTLGSQSVPEVSTGTASVLGGNADSSTAVEELGGSSLLASDFEQPPLRAFRKKRRRDFPAGPLNTNDRYWSEYDHPEDGDDEDGAYVIFIDPNERSTVDKWFDSVSGWFSRRKASDEESLLHTPSTPKDDESSSDEESLAVTPRARRHTSYGTVQRQATTLPRASRREEIPFLPQPTAVCLVASAVILIIGYLLAATGRHRYGNIVHAGVVLAFASSVLFVIAAVVCLARVKLVQQMGVAVVVSSVLIESIAAGGLLAQLVG